MRCPKCNIGLRPYYHAGVPIGVCQMCGVAIAAQDYVDCRTARDVWFAGLIRRADMRLEKALRNIWVSWCYP